MLLDRSVAAYAERHAVGLGIVCAALRQSYHVVGLDAIGGSAEHAASAGLGESANNLGGIARYYNVFRAGPIG
jgi:hypothetical protein